MRNWMMLVAAVVLLACLGGAGSAEAKGKGNERDVCRKADLARARAGVGDSDGDGIPDGEDPTPVVTKKIVVPLDTLTCPVAAMVDPPTPAVAGSIEAIGTTAVLNADTFFQGKTCEELAAQLALGEGSRLVRIRILENALHELNARSVTVVHGCRRPDHHHVGWPHDDDEDEDDGDDE